ncbi:hypothetical protein [Serratia ureilytica]|uniref:hypothetical protein n=1 Tax=Serratia ureilytica TaxID=300181 RepID=UPI000CAE337F|nr:hypothetical protein [Serratia ureilytica]PKR39734.1 hypothetical protein CU560_17345 [Serratia ureilytica]UUW19171.1 hypothetical protein NAL25_04450 [Serratia ureilytica]
MLTTLLVALTVLLMLWVGVTALLIGGMWVLPPLYPPPQAASTFWVWHFLRGGHGVCGTLRIGGVLAAIVWWCRTAGFSVSPQSQNALVLLMSLAALVALFNAGRRAELSSVGEVVFCGALGAAWMVTLGAGLYWLLFP